MSKELKDSTNSLITDEVDLLTSEDFRALTHSGRELSKELGLDQLLQNILQTASQLTNSPETSIILRNDREPTLYFAAATGDEAEWVLSTFGIYSETQIPIEGSKAGSVYRSGTSLVENVVRDHFHEVDIETDTATKSMVCVPLSVGRQRLGVMQVLNKSTGDYTQRDRVILEYFADQASVAIRNARLMESLLAHSGLYGSSSNTDELLERMNELNQPARTETLTILFADMRGFTQLCQSLLNPVLVQERLSEFISMLSQLVVDNDGVVNKFLGDGVMALFQGKECSVRAVKCAFSMVEQFSTMKNGWDETSNQQLDFLDLGVGIATDEVILGGIGGRGIRDYTAIGSAVNLAAAFENKARGGNRILCDQLTYRNVKNDISEVNAPEDFLLKKPGQEVGVRYKCYHLESLRAEQQVSLFISHSHKDRAYVEKLIGKLEALGVKTWYSVTDIPKGTLWAKGIRRAISSCNWMVVIVSENSSNARWVGKEVDLAANAGHLEDRIIPIVIDDTDPLRVNDYLSTMQAVYLSTCDDIAKVLSERFEDNADV